MKEADYDGHLIVYVLLNKVIPVAHRLSFQMYDINVSVIGDYFI